jgi:hypothetical protein
MRSAAAEHFQTLLASFCSIKESSYAVALPGVPASVSVRSYAVIVLNIRELTWNSSTWCSGGSWSRRRKALVRTAMTTRSFEIDGAEGCRAAPRQPLAVAKRRKAVVCHTR